MVVYQPALIYVQGYTSSVPCVGSVGSVAIYIYARDHSPPHFHALTAETAALITIAGRVILEGSLPKGAKKPVMAWAEKNEEMLQETWDRLNPDR